MKERIIQLCQDVINNEGVTQNIDCDFGGYMCECDICPLSMSNVGDNNYCTSRRPTDNIQIALDYLKEHNPSKDNVNSPTHYNKGNIEVIEVIEDWKLNFNLGNAIKYIARCEHKENKKQDLEKAKWYIERELQKC